MTAAHNLVRYLGYCGANAVVLPEDLADRSSRRALDGQADEDSTGPDRLETIRRVLARQGIALWLELRFDGPDSLPGLPLASSDEALRRGLVRVDHRGKADGSAFHPLHPDVRAAMKRHVVEAVSRHSAGAAQTGGGSRPGLLIRLGPGPTLLGTPDTGLDDTTFERFVNESFKPETARGIPGLGNTDADRFAVRTRYLAGVGRMPWLTWRAGAIAALYAELAQAAQAAAPGALLAVVTPGLDAGPAGAEARRVDRAGLAPGQAWRSVGLDLQAWPTSAGAPPVLRGAAVSIDALGARSGHQPRPRRPGCRASSTRHAVDRRPRRPRPPLPPKPEATHEDLADASDATSPAALSWSESSGSAPPYTDAAFSRSAGQKIWLTALPLNDGALAELPLGHAMAALDPQWLFLAENAVAGQEDRIRRFSALLRSLPAWPAIPADAHADPASKPFGIAVRGMRDDAQTFFEIANDSPYPIRLAGLLDAPSTATVDDLGRGLRLSPVPVAGGRNLVLDLLPYGVAAIRVGTPRARFSAVTPYPSEAVLASMQVRFNELTAQLARLKRGLANVAGEPANPSFEPDQSPRPSPPTEATAGGDGRAHTTATSPGQQALSGWHADGGAAGGATIAIDRDQPHSGHGSLKLDSSVAAASVVSDAFVPNIQSSLTIQAFFRASQAPTKIRIWVEGESAGKPYLRRTEMTVSTLWEERAVRASDVPPAGLDSVRVRFELLSKGSLWIDDLHIPSETASKSARLNVQRTLLAALQAYREERYADFARLAGSHWVRESTMTSAARWRALSIRRPK